MENYQKLHKLQEQHTNDDINAEERKKFHVAGFREDTADFWRHKRMYQTVELLARFYPESKWVTVGDGRYGLDSYHLNKMFAVKTFPTDISGNLLEKGKEMGIIDDYSVENAEQLSFPNNSYDVSFCKAAFHHFPRPMLALYEMIRVSRKAVVLIEPNDMITLNSPKTFVKQAKNWLVSILKSKKNNERYVYSHFRPIFPEYEESGNFVYKVSRRELTKVALGLNLKWVAWKGFNDHYIEGGQFEPADKTSEIYVRIKRNIEIRDWMCRLFPIFFDWGLITIVLFKEDIPDSLRASMKSNGFEFIKTSTNPYLTL